MSLNGTNINNTLTKLRANVRVKQKALNDAQSALINYNLVIEQQLKDRGITPITLYANKPWPTNRLYVLTDEGNNIINCWDYTNPGTAYDMLFSIANHPKGEEMFVVIELTPEYVEYLETLELLKDSDK